MTHSGRSGEQPQPNSYIHHSLGEVASIDFPTDGGGFTLFDRLGPEGEAALSNGIFLTPVALEDDFSEAKDFTVERIFSLEPAKRAYHIHTDPNTGIRVYVAAWYHRMPYDQWFDGIRLVQLTYERDMSELKHFETPQWISRWDPEVRFKSLLAAAGYDGPEQIKVTTSAGGEPQRAQLEIVGYEAGTRIPEHVRDWGNFAVHQEIRHKNILMSDLE